MPFRNLYHITEEDYEQKFWEAYNNPNRMNALMAFQIGIFFFENTENKNLNPFVPFLKEIESLFEEDKPNLKELSSLNETMETLQECIINPNNKAVVKSFLLGFHYGYLQKEKDPKDNNKVDINELEKKRSEYVKEISFTYNDLISIAIYVIANFSKEELIDSLFISREVLYKVRQNPPYNQKIKSILSQEGQVLLFDMIEDLKNLGLEDVLRDDLEILKEDINNLFSDRKDHYFNEED